VETWPKTDPSFLTFSGEIFLINGLMHHWFNNVNWFHTHIATLFMYWRCCKNV
jgi:hypothetical protein